MAAETGPPRVRRRVTYFGRVQGVFFRATAAELASGFGVVGYVRNAPDGTVELETEGAADQVDAFLQAVARHFRQNITRAQIEERPIRHDETRFQVRY